jgi:hypothetical protein
LLKRVGGAQIINNTEAPSPRPSVCVKEPIDINVTWLVAEHVHAADAKDASSLAALPFQFKIDRRVKEGACRTPRRNACVEACVEYLARQHGWASRVRNYFAESLLAIPNAGGLRLGFGFGFGSFLLLIIFIFFLFLVISLFLFWRFSLLDQTDHSLLSAERVFNTVVPLFEDHARRARQRELEGQVATVIEQATETLLATTTATSTNAIAVNRESGGSDALSLSAAADAIGPVVLDAGDIALFLDEERRSFNAVMAEMRKVFVNPVVGEAKGSGGTSPSNALITAAEGKIVLALSHVLHVLQRYYDAVNFVEDMLRRQLIAAIGTTPTPIYSLFIIFY